MIGLEKIESLLDLPNRCAEIFQCVNIVCAHDHVAATFYQRQIQLGYDLVHAVADPPAVAVPEELPSPREGRTVGSCTYCALSTLGDLTRP